MSKTYPTQKTYPVANALRAAGYIPLPRLWVKADDIPAIHAIAQRYSQDVNSIQADIHRAQGALRVEPSSDPRITNADPREDRDAAWAAIERERRTARH